MFNLLQTSSRQVNMLGSYIKDTRRQLALHQLCRHIDHLAALADDHRSVGIPKGDPRIQELLKAAEQHVSQHCATWQESRQSIAAQLPNFSRLQRLAESEPNRAIAAAIAALAGFVGMGALAGLTHLAYALVARLAQ